LADTTAADLGFIKGSHFTARSTKAASMRGRTSARWRHAALVPGRF
jgi:hypothetical protein